MRTWKTTLTILLVLVTLGGAVEAKVKTETVRYQHGDTTLEGYFAGPGDGGGGRRSRRLGPPPSAARGPGRVAPRART